MENITDRYTILEDQYIYGGASRTDMWQARDNKTGKNVFFRIYIKKIHISDSLEGQKKLETLESSKSIENEINIYKKIREDLITKPLVNLRNFLCIIGDGTFSKKTLFEWLKKSIDISDSQANENLRRTIFYLIGLINSEIFPRIPISVISKKNIINKEYEDFLDAVNRVGKIKDYYQLDNSKKYIFLNEEIEFGYMILPVIEDKVTLLEYMTQRLVHKESVFEDEKKKYIEKYIISIYPKKSKDEIKKDIEYLQSIGEESDFFNWLDGFHKFLQDKPHKKNNPMKISWNEYKDFLYDECINTFFIVLISLYMLASIGINHNDIHLDNILLNWNYVGENKYHKTPYLLVINKEILLVDMYFIPIIFDFDRGNSKTLDLYPILYGKVGGICPSFHQKRDILRVLCSLYQILHGSFDKYRNLCDQILNELFLDKNLANEIRLSDDPLKHCNLRVRDGSDDSVLCWDKYLDSGLRSNEEIVNWFLEKTSFQKIRLSELIDVSEHQHKSFYWKKVETFFRKFGKEIGFYDKKMDIVEEKNLIFTNIQFVSAGKNFEFWKENLDQTMNFVNLIYSILKIKQK